MAHAARHLSGLGLAVLTNAGGTPLGGAIAIFTVPVCRLATVLWAIPTFSFEEVEDIDGHFFSFLKVIYLDQEGEVPP